MVKHPVKNTVFCKLSKRNKMTEKQLKYGEEYKIIINEIDSISHRLTSIHSKHLQCKKGCDLCCMDYSIFPVEFYTILNQLKANKTIVKPVEKADANSCAFLNNHACTIYENRPVICRTHGLPLLYMNDDSEWELSACELNFTDFDFDEFSDENTIPMDRFNSKLFLLNKKFISYFKEKEFNETDLIPLKELSEHL